MKKPFMPTFLVFVCAVLSGVALFYTSQNVQRREGELRMVQVQLEREQEALRVLRAEWAFLNSPARLEALAAEYLDLAVPAPGQMAVRAGALPDAPSSEMSLPDAKNTEMFREVSFSAQEGRPAVAAQGAAESALPSDIFVRPRKKPLRTTPAVKKRFDALLDELDQEGGQ